MRNLKWMAALAALAAVLAVPAWAASGEATAESGSDSITVTGTGTAAATPDASTWSFGASAQADTAAAAQRAVSAVARRMIAAVKAAGVADKDVQTQVVSLSQRRSNDGERLLGWEASNVVAVTVREAGRAGSVVDAAVDAGASSVSGPSFTVAARASLERQALASGFDAARAKAQALAQKAGRTLGRVVSIAEAGAPTPVPFEARKAIGAADATPVEPGEQQVQAAVTVTFALS